MKQIIKNILEISEETQRIEFKRLGETKIVSKIIETIVAMTNTDGGWIIIGVDDPEETNKKGSDRIYGIEENKDIYDAINREIQKIIPPMSGLYEIKLIPEETINKTVALIKISKSIQSFRSINNSVFIRQQKGNKRLSPHEIIELNYAKGFTKADKELVNIDFDLLKTDYFNLWKKDRKLPDENLEKLFFKTGLARKNDQDILLPTRAAVFLFAEHPTNLMDTKCTIRVYKYKGVIEKFEAVPNLIGDPKTIEGPIIKLIKDAHEYILGLLESGIEILK
jgi:ATP-dependent DNA helicase RecG